MKDVPDSLKAVWEMQRLIVQNHNYTMNEKDAEATAELAVEYVAQAARAWSDEYYPEDEGSEDA